MRSWPSAVAIALGAIALLAGILIDLNGPTPNTAEGLRSFSLISPLLIGGAVLLAGGLHALQASFDSWCGCDDCMGGCDCCGDDCACGDCAGCKPMGAEAGHEGHDHGHGEHSH